MGRHLLVHTKGISEQQMLNYLMFTVEKTAEENVHSTDAF